MPTDSVAKRFALEVVCLIIYLRVSRRAATQNVFRPDVLTVRGTLC